MGLPAVVNDELVTTHAESMDAVLAWLADTSDPHEVHDIAERAKLAHTVFKTAKQSAEMAHQALRVHATALRKLAHLKEIPMLSPHLRKPAAWLGTMSEERFAEFLDALNPWDSLVKHYRDAFRDKEREDLLRRQREVARGHHKNPVRDNLDDVTVAAKTLLGILSTTEERFTIAEAAVALGEELGLGQIDALTESGLAEIMRHAIQADRQMMEVKVDGRLVRCPAFITYRENELGWVRVPWRLATLSQLNFMAELRAKQAAEVVAASADLALLVSAAQAAQTRYPAEQRLVVLLDYPREIKEDS